MARILLVDDEPSILCVLSNLLQSDGHSIAGTLRGDKARQLLRSKENFDILLTDLRMWPVSGMDLVRTAREFRPAMPVIVLTAYFTPETEEEAKKLGVSVYMRKPWAVDDLLSTVKRTLESAGSAQPVT
jgi:two-component system response regulator PilR (NtrC family)